MTCSLNANKQYPFQLDFYMLNKFIFSDNIIHSISIYHYLQDLHFTTDISYFAKMCNVPVNKTDLSSSRNVKD